MERGHETVSEQRLHEVELSQARMEARVEAIKHDTSNLRLMINQAEAKNEIRHGVIDSKIDDLKTSIWRSMLSLAIAVVMLLVGVVGYFISQKDKELMEHRSVMEVSSAKR